jgi:hypothetical protein
MVEEQPKREPQAAVIKITRAFGTVTKAFNGLSFQRGAVQ